MDLNLRLEYLIYLILPMLGSSIVSYLTGPDSISGASWYQELQKSPLTPPGWVFGLVWPILYASIGHVLYQLIKVFPGNPGTIWLLLNLALNYLWLIFFNGLHDYQSALFILGAMVVSLGLFMLFNKNTTLSLVLVPYLLWILFASYLNWYIVDNN